MAKLNQGFDKNSVPETPGKGGQKDVNIITQWPTQENAIIAKFILDPTYEGGKKMFRAARYFNHPTGNNESDKGNHICQSFFGAKSSPENDAFWEQITAMSAMKKAGGDYANTAEYKKAKELMKTFRPKDRGYFLILQPDNPTIQAIRVPGPALDVLLGRKADNYHKDEIPSLIDTMTKKGQSPFDIENTTGWVKLYRKGEKMNTEYFVEEAQQQLEAETKDGKKIKYMESLSASVHPSFLADIDEAALRALIPNVVEFERKFAWTVEESQKFVANLGTLAGVPEKAKKGERSAAPSAQAEADAAQAETVSTPEFAKVSSDDIPY